MRIAALIVLGTLAVMGWGSPPAEAHGTYPIPGDVVREFDPPGQAWDAGHRGIDLSGNPGDVVTAPAAGVVTFVGTIAGVAVVTIDHGDVRSTYQPVAATVAIGTEVDAGDAIGVLQAGHACPAAACLHWGLLRGETYLDPRLLLGVTMRLLPPGSAGEADGAAAQRAAAVAVSDGQLARPVPGPVISPFGLRLHPILHVWRLHAGVDFSAGCGTPILAAGDGVVVSAGYAGDAGNLLVLDHGSMGGRHVQTVYMHAQGYQVSAGQHVTKGEVVGWVGTTGLSTGCHLHFGVKADGGYVDPEGFL